MKKIFLIMITLLLIRNVQSPGQAGQNAFNTKFNNSATSLNMTNAYLLGFLATNVYPGYLRYQYSPLPSNTGSFVNGLNQDDDKFLVEYKNKMTFLFTPVASSNTLVTPPNNLDVNPALSGNKSTLLITTAALEPVVEFSIYHKCNTNGYDPEAVLISTPTTVYIIFRGTDRVSCNRSTFGSDGPLGADDGSKRGAGYQWGEWIGTDFKFLPRSASILQGTIPGNVHRGMAESLVTTGMAEELANAVVAVATNKITHAAKKVWITGHSLGGAHAQLFAMYLKYNKGITAQGIYIYESPHPGDAAFANRMNSDFGKSHIQRFEFGDDPICCAPPMSFGFARAGERNYFKDYNANNLRSEQILADDARLLCALPNLPGEQIDLTKGLEFPPICPGSLCFHHPTFILQAVRHQLPSSETASLPNAIPLPAAGDNCNQGDLNKANDNNIVNNTATAIEDLLSSVVVSAVTAVENLSNNLIGGRDGNYKLVCYKFKNCSKKYLHWDGTIGHQIDLSTTGTVFKLEHKGIGGYYLKCTSGSNEGVMAADVKFGSVLHEPTGQESTNNIIMSKHELVDGDEKTWYVLVVPNKTDTYVLYNWNTRKVLDAPDNVCNNSCACNGDNLINEFNAGNNDATQVWILQKQ